MTPILITQNCALGDNLLLTAAVRDLAIARPGEYEIHVRTHCPAIWSENPHIASWKGDPPKGAKLIPTNYQSYIKKADTEQLHFLTCYHRILAERLGVDVPVTAPKADLWLPKYYLDHRPIGGRYWLLIAGGKRDATVKIWSAHHAQHLVNYLTEEGIRAVQEGSASDLHPDLQGVFRMPPTTYMEFLWVIRHAEGVICPITAAMHAAAAFDKPCVVTAGGREHWWWEAYTNEIRNFGTTATPIAVPHRYLHTQDKLPCCMGKGCWKNKVRRTEQDKDGYFCQYPTRDVSGQYLALCMKSITPADVGRPVLSYYHDGTLAHGKVAPLTSSAAFQHRPGALPHILTGDPQDDPIIGGRIACGVVLRNRESDTASLLSICSGAPAARLRVLVAGQAHESTQEALRGLLTNHRIDLNDVSRDPVTDPLACLWGWMAKEALPDWLIFVDGVTLCTDPTWLRRLASVLIKVHPRKCRLLSALQPHVLSSDDLRIIRQQPWFADRPSQAANGQDDSAGDRIFSPDPKFFVIHRPTLLQIAAEPVDSMWMLAEQFRQSGYNLRRWNQEGQFAR